MDRDSFENELHNICKEGYAIGFIIDSKRGVVRKTGLITHPECVLALDELLGGRATLFYLDPRVLDGEKYADAVSNLQNNLITSGIVKFEIEAPCIMLMRYNQKQFSSLTVLLLNEKTICMWYSQAFDFISQYLESKIPSPPSKNAHGLKHLIKTHSGAIGIDALKMSIGQVLTQTFQNLM
jgi:hypothetical protein